MTEPESRIDWRIHRYVMLKVGWYGAIRELLLLWLWLLLRLLMMRHAVLRHMRTAEVLLLLLLLLLLLRTNVRLVLVHKGMAGTTTTVIHLSCCR